MDCVRVPHHGAKLPLKMPIKRAMRESSGLQSFGGVGGASLFGEINLGSNGRNAVSRVLFRRRELGEFCDKLGEFAFTHK